MVPFTFLAIARLRFRVLGEFSVSTPISNPFTFVTTGDVWVDCWIVNAVNSVEICSWVVSGEQIWVMVSKRVKYDKTCPKDNLSKFIANKVAVFILSNFPTKLSKNLIAFWTPLITDIGIPTPAIAVGVGKSSKTLIAVLVADIITSDLVKILLALFITFNDMFICFNSV